MQLIYVIWAMIYRISQTQYWVIFAQMCNLFSFEFATNLLIAVGTGTRLGEIFRLRWRDILAEEIRKYPAVLGEGRFASGAKSNKWASAYG